jgi:DNA polymerase-3 subunit gamma/tau
MLSQGAFNALLKTLEEPPSYAIFILATTEKHKILPTILSRCQVYDFTRITIADTIHHLQYVAKQEGVSVGEEALNVVAQKADGGMRDALSIFDQLVAFCGKDISYEQAIEVLNVLNSEYYFRMIDAALQGAVGDALLLFNEVLQKGFDAGHCIAGLSQHLRDVLVSKDAATAQLLETSDAIRQHYQQQATRCNARWIFNALEILNTCDIHFRTAKNKRLTVELALVKLCRLVEVPEAQTVGIQSAAKPVAQIVPQPANQLASQLVPKSEPQPQVSQPQIPKAEPVSFPISMPSIPSIPSISIKQSTTPSARPEVNETTPRSKEPRNTPFTLDQLIDAWAGLSENFPGEERLNAMLTTLVPELVSPELCRVTVANPWQRQEFGKFGKRVMDIVRDRLKNDNLRLQVEVGDYTKTTRAYTSSEKYKVLVDMNPHVAELKSRLNLQLE